jgi:hypothetical protein
MTQSETSEKYEAAESVSRFSAFHSRSRRPGIVAILPRGEAIRNFVYTDALDELAAAVELSVLSVVPNDRIWAELAERYARAIPLAEYPDSWIVRFIREELDLAHGRWLWSSGAQARWRWRNQEATTLPRRLKRIGKKLLCYPFANRRGLETLSGLEGVASRWFRATDEYLRLFRELEPALVFNGSQVHNRIALPALHAAKELGIPTATFLFSWDNLTSQGRIYPQSDYYIVWNEALRDGLLEIYGSLRPEQIFVTGTPQFDFHFRPEFYWSREEFCARIGADPHRPIVLYSTGMANHVIGEPWVVELIADLLSEMTEFGPPQLLVRVLPKGPQGHFDNLRDRRKDILIPPIPWEPSWLTPTFADAYLLTNTLRHSAVGVNIASTISLELCMFDKPVINIGFPPPHLDAAIEFDYTKYYDFEHYRPVVASGAIELALSEDDLRQKIIDSLKRPAERAPNRAALLSAFFGHSLDGRSSARVAQALLEIVDRKREFHAIS